jgi:hypothetical protein
MEILFHIAGDRKKYFKSAPLWQTSNYLKIIEAETFVINKMYNEKQHHALKKISV